MNILIIGSGGREHAITYKIAQVDAVKHIYVAPGNAGTHREAKASNIDIDVLDFTNLINFAKQNHIHLTIVGPEAPLAAGIIDAFQAEGLPCFGPTQEAAQLESSKAFAKAFLTRHGIPTARSQTFKDYDQAKEYLSDHPYPVVIKADGLCAGKGVVIAHDEAEALNTLDDMLNHHRFADASSQVVIEEFLSGEEASYIILTDGKAFVPFATSQDHKARDDEDKGPNTGGMGAYSPAPVVNEILDQTIIETIIAPTLHGLAEDGIEYKGFLYVGLMMTESGPKVLEFNCRLGDPEAQVLLMRLESSLLDLMQATLDSTLAQMQPSWTPSPCVGVVMCATGYPENPQTGDTIEGLNDIAMNPNLKVFHAGSQLIKGEIKTTGGRVLCVCAMGPSIIDAKDAAYQTINKIKFNGAFYRRDIAQKAIDRLVIHA